MTGSLHLHRGDGSAPPARRLAESLRETIRSECGVTCSVGVATNRLLAKIGSELNKPDGLTMMPSGEEEIAAFLAPRPVGILWGIGKRTEEALAPYGIRTCGDIQRLSPDGLKTILGSSAAAESLSRYARGMDDSPVAWMPAEEKSVSREHTFAKDESRRDVVRAKLLELVAEVGMRFREEERWARTARIKLRDSDFATRTRQTAFDSPARDDMTFREKALELFDAALRKTETLPTPVRLIGFGVSNIQSTPDTGEPTLFPSASDRRRERRERLSLAIDGLRRRGMSVQ